MFIFNHSTDDMIYDDFCNCAFDFCAIKPIWGPMCTVKAYLKCWITLIVPYFFLSMVSKLKNTENFRHVIRKTIEIT